MAELLPGHIQARQALARLQASNPQEFAARYGNMTFEQIVASDRTLQDMIARDQKAATQLRGLHGLSGYGDADTQLSPDLAYTGGNTPRYSTAELERIARERQAALTSGGASGLATTDYNDQLKHAQDLSAWWDANPDGGTGDDWFGKLIKAGVGVLTTVAVVATAGAAAGVFGPATSAGNAAAAAAGSGTAGTAAVNTAVTSGITTAATSTPAVAATVASTLEAIPVVTITGTKVATTSMLPALVGAAAVGAPLAINHALLETMPEVAAGSSGPGLVDAAKAAAGLIGGNGSGGVGGALTGAALAAALGALTTKDMPVDGDLNSSIDKLTKNSDAQMKEWNEWMYPQLKGALADSKATTDAFVGKANANAGQLEGMGASARGLGDLYNQRNNNIYIPLADKIIADANKFNKEGFAEQQAGLAVGDLSSAYAAQRQQRAQQMAQYGVDPSSGRALAIDAAGGINHAANSAAAATRARMAGEELWGKKQMDALGTSTALNANAAGINASYRNSADMYTGATGLRQQGVKASNDYFTSVSDLAKTATNTYAGANAGYSSAGQLGLGRSKIESDRYIAEQEGRGKVIGAGLQAINSNGGITKTVGDIVDTGGKIWNALKGIWE